METLDKVDIVILGCGYMGTALLEGWLAKTKLTLGAYVKTDTSRQKLQQKFSGYKDRLRLFSGDSIVEAAGCANVVLLGFLPGDLETFTRTPQLADTLRNSLIVSMLAGVKTREVERCLVAATTSGSDSEWKIARIIPTIGARIGESVTLLAEPDPSPSHLRVVHRIFSDLGSVHVVPESQMDAATAINAATHALAIVALDSITDASVASGVPRATASAIAAACLQSAGALFLPERGGMTPESMKAAMSTPSGITLNAVVDLDASVRGGIGSATKGAIEYAKSMGG